jgi:hypothetical protein
MQIDHVHAEPLQARLAGADDKLGPVVGELSAGAAEVAELGGDDGAVAAALERRAEQCLVLALTVGVGGIEHGDAGLQRLVDQRSRGGVLGRTIGAGKRHAAEPDGRAVDAGLADRALGQ